VSDPGYGQGRPDYGMPGQPDTYPTQAYPSYQQQQGPAYQQSPQGPGYQPQDPAYQQGPAYQQQGPAYQAQPGFGSGTGYDTGFPVAPSQQKPAGSKGFFGSLFDVSFDSFVTPSIVKVVYILAMIGIGFFTLWLAIIGFTYFGVYGFIFLIVLCPLYFLFSLLLTRIYMELIMVIFRLANDIRVIRDRGGIS
jgi:hypothetical protein